MIKVRNLTKKYGPTAAVKNISFTVEKGHIYGFLGPNGAGKSTTMNIISGCLAATDGEVEINGYDIYEDPIEAKKCIGYLPEIPPLYPEMTPYEYLMFVGGAKRLSGDELYQDVERVMKRTGVDNVSDRLIRNLSKGYRQRVGIAQAILGNPEIIILDEPTVGLDPGQIIEIRDLIRELGKEHVVILSSHILSEISAVCDYVIIISKGHIVASDTIENLTRSGEGVNVIKVESRGDVGSIKKAVSALPFVNSCTANSVGNTVKTIIDVEGTEDVRDDIFNTYVKLGMPIVAMSSGIPSLEDVFIELTSKEFPEDEPKTRIKKEKAPAAPAPKGASPLGGAYYDDESEDEKKSCDGTVEDSGDSEYSPLFSEADTANTKEGGAEK